MKGLLLVAALLMPLSGLAEPAPSPAEAVRVELNRASVQELGELPGIGPKKAEAIVALREQRPFTRVSQLLNIRGIGMKTLKKLRPLVFIEVEPVATKRN